MKSLGSKWVSYVQSWSKTKCVILIKSPSCSGPDHHHSIRDRWSSALGVAPSWEVFRVFLFVLSFIRETFCFCLQRFDRWFFFILWHSEQKYVLSYPLHTSHFQRFSPDCLTRSKDFFSWWMKQRQQCPWKPENYLKKTDIDMRLLQVYIHTRGGSNDHFIVCHILLNMCTMWSTGGMSYFIFEYFIMIDALDYLTYIPLWIMEFPELAL